MGGDVEDPPLATCPGMCPAREAELRRCQRRLHRLEMEPSGQAVKEYSRPAAGKERPPPEELRPPAVLLATVRYLLGEAARARPDVSAAEQCAFVADRLRAVSLDLTLQRVSGRPCAALLERSLVYLLHAGYQLCAQPPARFDAHLHRAHIQECFSALRRAYRDGEKEEELRASEPRFQALFLLYNLGEQLEGASGPVGSWRKSLVLPLPLALKSFQGRRVAAATLSEDFRAGDLVPLFGSPEALWQILQLPSHIRASPEVSVALEIHWAYLERNFACFFRRARKLPYLPSCALHQHVASARRMALLTFSHGFSAKNCRYPLGRLAQLLTIDSLEEAAELCRAQGLAVVEDGVVFQKVSYKNSGLLEQRPAGLLVDRKWGKSTLLELSEAVCS